MIIKIFTGPNNYDISSLYNKEENEFIIGVDIGAYLLSKNKINMDLALGDFDSVNEKEYATIKEYSNEIKIFKEKKNFTDTYLAIQHALLMDYDEIVIYGGTGGRFDHEFANMNLLKLEKISIVSNNVLMYMLDPGSYEIENEFNINVHCPKKTYDSISLMKNKIFSELEKWISDKGNMGYSYLTKSWKLFARLCLFAI